MSLLTQPSELKEKKIFKGLIYGEPGVGKTTLALSAPNPVCIDLDRGIDRVEKRFQVSSLQVDNYQQVLDLINSSEIDDFDTIIIDTLGKLVDRMGDWIAEKDPRMRQSNGQLTMRGWGMIKIQFKIFFKLLEGKNKSIIFVAHAREEKQNEDTKVRPDVSGSSGKDIIKELDFMGYMEMKSNVRTITFCPSEKFYAKNSLGLNNTIKVNSLEKGNNFVKEKIIKSAQKRIEQDALLREQYDLMNDNLGKEIKGLKDLKEVNEFYGKFKEDLKSMCIWDSYEIAKRLFTNKTKELNFEFDKEKNEFVEIKNKKEEVA
jgi:transcription initiation factor IIF auxiliary subunit